MREMDRTEEIAATAQFFDRAIRDIARPQGTGLVRVLDFGCGSGELVERLLALGYDAHGCDVVPAPAAGAAAQRYRRIELSPYRLPFDDGSFDVVLSASVLEHARNPEEYLV